MKKLIILLSLIFVIEIHSQEVASKPNVAKELIRQWIQTEKQLSDEQEKWKQEKEHITELLELYEKELKLLSEELATVESVELDEEKKQDLENKIKQEDLKRSQLRKFLLTQKPRVLALIKKFPQPLQEQISETVAVLNAPETDNSTRDILMPMISVIEAGNSFNAGVFRTSQKVVIGSEEWQAEVMYLGLAQAYFWVGDKAGVGSPSTTKSGWEWKRDDAKLEAIKKAMSVFDKTTQPELIKLPFKVTNLATKKAN